MYKKHFVIYKATNIINNKFYIGKDSNWPCRKNAHLLFAFNEKSREYNTYFSRAIRKYGKENFKWEILYDNIDENKLEIAEICSIYTFKPQYNLTEGGEGVSGYKHTEESKKKISQKHKGKIVSQLTRQKMSISNDTVGEKNPMHGVHRFGLNSPRHNIKPFNVFLRNTKEYIGTWIVISECSRDLNCNIGDVCACLNHPNTHKSCKGYEFKYKEST